MSRRLPNLNQLRAFEAAARHLSFKKAAEELHVTHAAVSHQIKALEADLGRRLFHRKTRRVELTLEAEGYAEILTAAFGQMLEATLALSAASMEGILKVSSAPFYGNRMVLPLLADFHREFPQIKVEVDMDGAVIDFGTSDFDAGIRYGDGRWKGLTALVLHKDQLVPVAHPDLVSARKLPLEPSEIAALTLGVSDGQMNAWARWFAAVGFEPENPPHLLHYGNRGRMIDLAFSGAGVALADRRVLARDLEMGNIVQLHPLHVDFDLGMWVVFPDTAHPDPRVIAFAELLKARILGQDTRGEPNEETGI